MTGRTLLIPPSAHAVGAPSSVPVQGGHRLGIDVGGTGIKYGVVDLAEGRPAGPIAQAATPRPASPEAIATVLAEVVTGLPGEPGPYADAAVGIALPAVVHHGIARSAANIDPGWIGLDAKAFLAERLGRRVEVVNDADAAGLAEVRYGAARGVEGVVLVITLGTGIGSAMFVDGKLVPNTELGHLEVGGSKAEARASALAREREGLGWEAYAVRLQRYLAHLESLFSPDLIVVGGGISARSEDFLPLLDLRTRIVPAGLRNAAGVVGAAAYAQPAP